MLKISKIRSLMHCRSNLNLRKQNKQSKQPTNLLGIWAAVKVQIMQIQNWGWNSCEDQFSEKNSVIQLFFLCTVFIMTFDETGDLVTPVLGTFQKTLTSRRSLGGKKKIEKHFANYTSTLAWLDINLTPFWNCQKFWKKCACDAKKSNETLKHNSFII